MTTRSDGGTVEPAQMVSKRHTVRRGDTVVRLAQEHGFYPKDIWEHPDNEQLRALRRDPNILQPGDVLFIPEKEPKVEEIATTKRHTFRLRGMPALYRVQLFWGQKPIASQPFVLLIEGGKKLEGSTDGDGVVEVKLPPSSRRGELWVGPPPAPGKPDRRLRYDLRFGHLDPEGTWTGVRQRLRNIGFQRVAAEGDRVDDALREALVRFQHRMGLKVTGVPDRETCAKLESFHDHRSKYPQPKPIPPEPPPQAAPPPPSAPLEVFEWELVELVEVVGEGDDMKTVSGVAGTSAKLGEHPERRDNRQYVNLSAAADADPPAPMPSWSRVVWVRARIEVKAGRGSLANKTIRFAIDEEAHRSKPAHLEGSCVNREVGSDVRPQWCDVTTDADGWTPRVKVELSAYGGDQATIRAQALVEGRRAGPELRAGPYEVWRKVWLVPVHLEGESYPACPGAISNLEESHVELVISDGCEIARDQAPAQTYYPQWMALCDGSVPEEPEVGDDAADPQVSVVARHNFMQFFFQMQGAPSVPLSAPMVMCRRTFGAVEKSEPQRVMMTGRSMACVALAAPKAASEQADDEHEDVIVALHPALHGGPLLVEGRWEYVPPDELDDEERSAVAGAAANAGKEPPPPGPASGALTPANVLPRRGRRAPDVVTITLPEEAPDPTKWPVRVTFSIHYTKPFEGLARIFGSAVSHDGEPSDAFNQAVAHEIAHLFGQTSGDNPFNYDDAHGGTGWHCAYGATKKPRKDKPHLWVDGQCTMFHAVAANCQRFCRRCDRALRLHPMTQLGMR